MKRLHVSRPSPAMLVAIMALIVAIGGSAYAAKKIGSKQLKKNAVTTKKIKNKAVTTAKLANGAVTTAKLTQGERSEGFVTNQSGAVPLPATTDTTVASLNLPSGGHYLLTAAAALANTSGSANFLTCELRDDGTVVSTVNTFLPGFVGFLGSITLTGVSDGGTVSVACNPGIAAQARSRVITATRVASVITG